MRWRRVGVPTGNRRDHSRAADARVEPCTNTRPCRRVSARWRAVARRSGSRPRAITRRSSPRGVVDRHRRDQPHRRRSECGGRRRRGTRSALRPAHRNDASHHHSHVARFGRSTGRTRRTTRPRRGLSLLEQTRTRNSTRTVGVRDHASRLVRIRARNTRVGNVTRGVVVHRRTPGRHVATSAGIAHHARCPRPRRPPHRSWTATHRHSGAPAPRAHDRRIVR